MAGSNVQLNTSHLINTDFVHPSLLEKLNQCLFESPRRFAFRCCMCKKMRVELPLQDPGILTLPRTCTDAGRYCSYPEDKDAVPSPQEYVPGSLVLCRFRGVMWPAVVEFSTDEHRHYALYRHNENTPYAYYITFIRADPDFGYGGWFTPENLKPFTIYTETPPGLTASARNAYEQADIAAHWSLRLRLTRLSFIATKLRELGFDVSGTPPVGRNEVVE